ncbi:hypothetical protein [Enterococcus asini]|uniref:hypothetical protein n=1 Tax=Enterococcus asini TaxID=57732 RepID=UPI0022E5DA18|nr:hypothetical protein [Enterococcus asini]
MNDERLNNPWQPMTLQEVVGIFALPVKKPPDYDEVTVYGYGGEVVVIFDE